MTREHKLSLILGFAVVLVVGVLLSDHLSGARTAQPDQIDPATNLALLDDASRRVTEPPSLVLVDPRGRPVNIAPAGLQAPAAPVGDQLASGERATPSPFSDSTMFKPVTQDEADPSRLAHLKEQLAGTFNDLANGHGPQPAAVIEQAPPTLKMATRPEPTRSNNQPTTSGAMKTYTVRANDTLWAIAQRTLGDGFRHKELAELNRDRIGPEGELRVGATLRLPTDALMADAAPSPANRTAPKESAAKAAPAKATSTYTVKPGDTLGVISQRLLGTSRRYRDILEANRNLLDDADSLRAGMVLKIPAR